MSDYADTNGNGVPDAFENRLPISEILNLPLEEYGSLTKTIILKVELMTRCPEIGELAFITCPAEMWTCDYETSVEQNIVRRVIAAPPDFSFQPEKQKD
jgi:hypothetical protein